MPARGQGAKVSQAKARQAMNMLYHLLFHVERGGRLRSRRLMYFSYDEFEGPIRKVLNGTPWELPKL